MFAVSIQRWKRVVVLPWEGHEETQQRMMAFALVMEEKAKNKMVEISARENCC